jgi:AraC-like DNA-binding protein
MSLVETADPYDAWRKEQSPERLHAVLQSLAPTKSAVLNSIGAGNDPVLSVEADLITSDAVRKYEPTAGSTLPTFVSRQLQGLRRLRRQKQQVLAIPERTQLNSWAIAKGERELQDKLNREPTVEELSDHVGMSPSQIARTRRKYRMVASQAALGDLVSEEGEDRTEEALEYLYNESDTLDKKILELRMGYGGSPKLDHGATAARLSMQPYQLTRRIARIVDRLNRMQEQLEAI